MQQSYTTWGRMGPVQYVASPSGRVLTTDHALAFLPFDRGHGGKDALVAALRKNLWVAYESVWRLTRPGGKTIQWFDVESRGAVQQGVAAFWIEDLCAGLDTLPDYWARNYRALFHAVELGWSRLQRICTHTAAPIVLRSRCTTFDAALIPMYTALWRAMGFVDRTATTHSGHRLFFNTSCWARATLRERALAIRELPEGFRARIALCNDDLDAVDFARLCTALRIPGALDVGTARTKSGARVAQGSELFAAIRAPWERAVHTTITVSPNFTVFLREPPDAADAVDRFVRHFTARDAAHRWQPPHVVLVPSVI